MFLADSAREFDYKTRPAAQFYQLPRRFSAPHAGPALPAALAAALRLLLVDPALRSRMGARGIETARAYGWDRIVDRLETIYHTLASPARAIAAPASRPDERIDTAPLEAAVR